VLKIITTVRENPESLRVHLYGQFTGEYVPEIEKALSGQSADTGKVVLDLSNVTFVDCAAMLFLCGAKSRNVAIENIPSSVTPWIDQEGRCGSAHSYPSEKRSARRDITNEFVISRTPSSSAFYFNEFAATLAPLVPAYTLLLPGLETETSSRTRHGHYWHNRCKASVINQDSPGSGSGHPSRGE
jgi:ABC-type transporter Mla MlaB component